MTPQHHVLVLSPHFDDVALSLGQSLLDGHLSRCRVRVRVAFGRTNWTVWVHPNRRRAVPVSLWRRMEETAAALRFGYRWRAGSWEESVLRTGQLDPDLLLDAERDLDDDPLVEELGRWVVAQVEGSRRTPDLLLSCAGLGGHVDHRLLAAAVAKVAPRLAVPVGYYEDRPYAAYLDQAARAAQLAFLGPCAESVDVSDPVTAATQRWVRRCYPSQIDGFFREAMDLDRATGSAERIWFPAGARPDWLAAAG